VSVRLKNKVVIYQSENKYVLLCNHQLNLYTLSELWKLA